MDWNFIVICTTVLLKIKLVQCRLDGDCKAECLRKDDTKCSDVFLCDVSEYEFDRKDYSSERHYFPNIMDHGIALKCDKSIPTQPRIGFLITWRVQGHDIIQEHITRFLIEVYGGDNGQIDIKKFIDIPEKLPLKNEIKFTYFFTTTNDDFEIKGGRYEIRIDMVPRSIDFDMKLLGKPHVPVYFDGDLKDCEKGAEKNETWTPTPPREDRNKLTFVAIGISLTLMLALVLVITFKIYCKRKNKNTTSLDSETVDSFTHRTEENKKRKSSDTLLTHGNDVKILILCNPGVIGNEEWKESVMKIKTKLSENIDNITFNWEEQQQGKAFVDWLHSKMTWADIVVIISVPDNYEFDDVNFLFFNKTVHAALRVRHKESLNITVAHQDTAKNHSKCPFLFLKYVENVRIHNQDRSWTILYKHITGNEAVELNGVANATTNV